MFGVDNCAQSFPIYKIVYIILCFFQGRVIRSFAISVMEVKNLFLSNKKHADLRALLRECEVQKDDEAQNDSVGTEDSKVALSDVVHEFLNDHHGHDKAHHGAQDD